MRPARGFLISTENLRSGCARALPCDARLMNEIEITRRILRRAMREAPAASQPGKAILDFGRLHAVSLFGVKAMEAKKLSWTAMKRAVTATRACTQPGYGVLTLARDLAALLRLDAIDSAIVAVVFALDRLRLPRELNDILSRFDNNQPAMIGEAAGAEPQDAERRVRLNPLFRMGLATFRADWRGQIQLETRWALENLLDRLPDSEAGIIAVLVGPRHCSSLPFAAFCHIVTTGKIGICGDPS